MFEPMFMDEAGSIPARVLILGFAFMAATIGLFWMRRITTGEPQISTFRATAEPGSRVRFLPLLAGIAILGALFVWAVATNRFVLPI